MNNKVWIAIVVGLLIAAFSWQKYYSENRNHVVTASNQYQSLEV